MSVKFDISAPYDVEGTDVAFARPQGMELLARVYLPHPCAPATEPGRSRPESASVEAERLLYLPLVGAIEVGLVRTAEDVLTVLRQVTSR